MQRLNPDRNRLELLDLLGHGCVDDAIEEELECAVWLSTEENLWTEQDQLSFTHVGLCNSDPLLEMFLSPSPAAAQRPVCVKPGYTPHSGGRRAVPEAKRRAGGEEHIHVFGHAPCQWV